MSIYLQMDGVDDRIVIPQMQMTAIEMVIMSENTLTTGQQTYWSLPFSASHLMRNNGLDTWHSTVASVTVNGEQVSANNAVFIPSSEKVTVRSNLSSAISYNIHIFSNGSSAFLKGRIYSIKIYNGEVLQAHYDMSTSTVNDISGNSRNATKYGGTWVREPTPPIASIVSVNKSKISDELNMNQSIIKVKFDQAITEYVARLNGVDHTTGDLVHTGGALALNREGEIIVDWNELTTEGVNRINIYGKNASGLWTGRVDIEQPQNSTLIYTKDRIVIALVEDKLLWSNDLGASFTKQMSIEGISPIKYIHVFDDDTVMFCTHTKAYYSTDFITYTESTILDQNKAPLTLTGYDNLSNFNHNQSGTMIVNGVEIHAWGNYSIHANTTFSNIRMWYTTDKGRTVKVARRFGGYDNSEIVRHMHFVTFNQDDKSFWIGTGDNIYEGTEERHLIKAIYNTTTDTWAWERVGSGYNFKITNLVFYEGYAYWAWDVPQGGVIKAPITSIGDISTHQKIMVTENDTNDIIISERGELLVLQTIWGGNEPARNFYYSPDRINFHKIYGTMPPQYDNDTQSLYYSVRPPNADGRVLAGVVSLTNPFEDWNLLPSVYLDDMVRASGFPNAFRPLPPTPPIVTDGLVGYWNSKQGVSGTTWSNIAPSTTNSFNAVVTNATAEENGMTFSGTNSFATFPVPTGITANTDVTMELRVKLPTYPSQMEILSYDSTYSLYINSGRIYFEISKDSVGVHYLFPSTPNEEIYLTIQRRQSDGYMTILKNGIELTDRWDWGASPNMSFFPQGSFHIGKAFSGAGWHAVGVVDNIKIYNRLLTQSEIQQNLLVGREVGIQEG